MSKALLSELNRRIKDKKATLSTMNGQIKEKVEVLLNEDELLDDALHESENALKSDDAVFKTFKAEIKSEEEDGSLNMFIPVSTSSMDRDGEIIEPSAFKKTIPRFMKHPVLIASHDYRDLTNQIGEWKKLKLTEGGLEGNPKYYVNEGNEQADWAYKLAQKGVAAFSIGFIPKVWEDGDGQKSPRRTFKEVELLEISQVIIPSNREAIMSMRSKSVDPIVNEILDEVEKELITKPEETDELIRIPVRDCKVTATIDISKDEGISALYCGKEKQVRTYLFRKDKGWTMAKARAWVKDHAKEYLITETTTTENEDITITVVKTPDTPQIYKEKKTSQEQIIDEIDYLKALIESAGMNDTTLKSISELVKSTWGEMIKMDMGKMQEMHDMMASAETMAKKSKKMAEDMMSDMDEGKRISGSDIPVKDNFTNQEILESLKRISNIGG